MDKTSNKANTKPLKKCIHENVDQVRDDSSEPYATHTHYICKDCKKLLYITGSCGFDDCECYKRHTTIYDYEWYDRYCGNK